jgi:hypothetical protein
MSSNLFSNRVIKSSKTMEMITPTMNELQTHDMITPRNYPTADEFVHHEIANNFDSYDGN